MTNPQLITQFIINSPMNYLNCEITPWGRMFSDETNKESYMSNYAVITKNINIERSIEEIEAFYQPKNILPKIFILPDSLPLEQLRPLFLQNGYSLREFKESLMILENPILHGRIKDCVIRQITNPLTDAEYALCIEQDNNQTYGVNMINRQLAANSTVFCAYNDTGIPVCMALAEVYQGAVYISDVYTTPPARGQGYASAVIEAVKKAFPEFLLFLYASSDIAIRIYNRAGFIGRAENHCWAVKGSLPAWCME